MGKATLSALKGKDFEDLVYMTNPSFWRMIANRRKPRPLSWKEAKKRLK